MRYYCLQTRGVECSNLDVLWKRSYENDWHVFFSCDAFEAEAKNLWLIIKENLKTADGFVSLYIWCVKPYCNGRKPE